MRRRTARRSIRLALLAGMLAAGGGCLPVIDEPGIPVVEVATRDAGATVDLDMQQRLVIRLDASWTTGYRWLLIDRTGQILETVGDAPDYQEQANLGGLLGLGGQEVWTFRPLARGDGLLRFEYRRPWGEGREAIRSAVFNVRVR